jgi:hypothetical protein
VLGTNLLSNEAQRVFGSQTRSILGVKNDRHSAERK